LKIKSIRWVWGILIALSSWTWAQGTPAPEEIILESIELRDLTLVSDSLIQSQIESKVGEAVSPRVIARDIRRLSDLGFFTNIEVHLEEINNRTTLIYQFFEEQTISEITIIGNKKIKDRDIRSALSNLEGDGFYEEAYETEHNAILKAYREKGFLNATVDVTVEEIEGTGIHVTYLIHEGKKAKIKRIQFEGNESLSNHKLRKTIQSGNGILFLGGKYKEEQFEQDLKEIVNKYGDIGRLEANVHSTNFDYKRNGKRIVITINLTEGPEYTLDQLSLSDNNVFTISELLEHIQVKPNNVHNKRQVEEDAQELEELYNDNGYVRAQVTPVVTLDYENHTTNVTHKVREADLKYINKVIITGNSVTKDEVARRNISLVPGERYDGSLLRDSMNDLGRSRYFEAIRPTKEDVPGDNRLIDLLMDVDEGDKGIFKFGAGLNSDTGIGGYGELSLNNFDISNPPRFTGGGQQFTAMANIGDYNTEYRVGFTDPEFFGYPITVGVDIFDEHSESRGGSRYAIDQQGARLRFAKQLSNNISLRTYFGYKEYEISGLETFVLTELRELEKPGDTLSWGWGIVRDTANHYIDPTKGTRTELNIEYSGFGSDNEFVKVMTEATWYHGFKKYDKWSVSFSNREGWAHVLGDKEFVPLSSRFFAGGSNTIRGYDNRDVGPKALTFRDINGNIIYDDEAIGGEFRVLNTLEAKYKVSDSLRAYTFFDGGGVWLEADDFDVDDMRYSVGVGLGLRVPLLGDLRLDYGIPLNPDDDQGSGQLHLMGLVDF